MGIDNFDLIAGVAKPRHDKVRRNYKFIIRIDDKRIFRAWAREFKRFVPIERVINVSSVELRLGKVC